MYKNYSEQRLYEEGKHAVARRNYGAAIKYFEALDALYPFSPYAERGDLGLIYAYYQNGDYPNAVAASNRFIHLYPRNPHADYAYYMRAMGNLNINRTFFQRYVALNMSQRDLVNAHESFFNFRDLVEQYPNSMYAADARQHMIYLRNLFAQYEIDVANYYLDRHAYVAAANRATYVVQHYPHTPQVEEALHILVITNSELGVHKSAEDAQRVLQANS